MAAHKLGGKPLQQVDPYTAQRQAEKEARQQAELEDIKDASAARIQLGCILYETKKIGFNEPEQSEEPAWHDLLGNGWRDTLTDAEILEREYRTRQLAPGYTRADLARDQVGEIEKLLEPLRRVFGPSDYDLQRGTQYRNYLQTYSSSGASGESGKQQKKKPGPKGKRYTKTLSALLIEDGATEERAAQIIEVAKKWAKKEGTPGLACTLLVLQEVGELDKDREPGRLWSGAELEGIAPDNTRRNFSEVFKGGANSIDAVTRKQIKADIQK